MVFCAYCGIEISGIEEVETADGSVCNRCADSHYTTCHDCGALYKENINTVYILLNGSRGRRMNYSQEDVCDDCFDAYEKCEHCEEYFLGSVGEHHGREFYCTPCAENNYFTCDDCGEFLNNDDYGADGLCGDCHGSNNDEDEHDDDDVDRVLRPGREMGAIQFRHDAEMDKILADPKSEL